MTPYDIIEKLRETSGLNDKRAILREHKDDTLFQKVLTYAFDPRITFGIKKIPEYNIVENLEQTYNLNYAIDSLDFLVNRDITGNAAIKYLQNILSHVSEENSKVIKWIISKDFKAGFNKSLINAEMTPFHIYEVPYMGATSSSTQRINNIFLKHEYGISEVKMDGRYLNILALENENIFESRGGRPNPLMGALENEANAFRQAYGSDVCLNGELMLKGTTDRYKANGIIASYISIAQKEYDGKDISKEKEKFAKEHHITLNEAKELLTFVVWDFIPLEYYNKKVWNKPRKERLDILEDILNKTKAFQIIEYKIVHNISEALNHFQEMLARGEEGTILKGSEGQWKDGKPVWQLKMKLELSLDLRIVGFNYGTPGTKNENVISSINVETDCGELKTSPGGLKEKDMKYITENQTSLLDEVAEIKCSGLSKDSEGNWSCLHPVFQKIRDDKDSCDTLKSAIENEKMAKGLK